MGADVVVRFNAKRYHSTVDNLLDWDPTKKKKPTKEKENEKKKKKSLRVSVYVHIRISVKL